MQNLLLSATKIYENLVKQNFEKREYNGVIFLYTDDLYGTDEYFERINFNESYNYDCQMNVCNKCGKNEDEVRLYQRDNYSCVLCEDCAAAELRELLTEYGDKMDKNIRDWYECVLDRCDFGGIVREEYVCI